MIKRIFVSALLCCASGFLFAQFPFQNNLLKPEERAKDLMGRLTLEEKVTLMMNGSDAIPRLGIKKYEWWSEALHGVARNGTATVFPQAIGMAASFDDSLLYKVFSAVSDEARVKNRIARNAGDLKRYQGLNMWTPNINIFRDPRWGRGQETYGEDPFLTSVMGVAVIKGLQGNSIGNYDKLHACAKHYAVHSGPEAERHKFDVENLAPRDLWETYLPAFKAAVQKADVKEVMCAYNSFEGAPCCGSNRLLTNILRNNWGYKGLVVSDCGAINDFYNAGAHQVFPDAQQSSAAAVLSGTDLECGSSYKSIVKAVESGFIKESDIDISVTRILTARFELGEMDSSSPWDYLPDSTVNSREHQKLALQMAQKSIVLLQNNGVLPLKKYKRIAVIGPNANDSVMQWGNYNGTPRKTITLLEGMRNLLPGTEIVYTEACGLTDKAQSLFDQCLDKGEKGFSVSFWNNTTMEGEPAVSAPVESAVKINKNEAFAQGVNLKNFSARYHTIFTPAIEGKVQFVFTTRSNLTLFIDNQPVKLDSLTPSVKSFDIEVLPGKSYDIAVNLIRGEETDGFRFDLQRTVKQDFAKTLALIKDAGVVIYAGGISASLEREEGNVFAPGFKGGDRTSIELPQIQRNLLEAIKKTGVKLVFVDNSGSAMGLVPETNICDAIIQAWYPGEAGGLAVAGVLLGKYNPAGRLPVTFYKNVEQLPDFSNYDMKGRTYRYMTQEPLFPFGYGLSYTSFKYGTPIVDKNTVNVNNCVLNLTIPLTNTGKMDGEEVVQVYLKKVNDTNGPNKTLRAFRRVNVPAGKTISVSFNLTSDNLEWWDESAQSVLVYPGDYQLMVGKSSKDADLQLIPVKIL